MAMPMLGVCMGVVVRTSAQVDVGAAGMVRRLCMSGTWHHGPTKEQLHQHDQNGGESHGFRPRIPAAVAGASATERRHDS